MLSIAFLASNLILGVQNEKINIHSPKFTSIVIDSNGTLAYKFTCTMYTLPAGGLLHFYVNQRSTDTMRFYNNSCFNKNSKCTDDICSCSFLDFTFNWRHEASKSYTLNIFEVEMKFNVNNLGKVKTSLRRTYNKTALMDMNYDWHTTENSDVDTDRNGTSPNGSMVQWLIVTLVCIFCFGVGGVIGMLFSLYRAKVKRRGCVKKAVVKEENVLMEVHIKKMKKELKESEYND